MNTQDHTSTQSFISERLADGASIGEIADSLNVHEDAVQWHIAAAAGQRPDRPLVEVRSRRTVAPPETKVVDETASSRDDSDSASPARPVNDGRAPQRWTRVTHLSGYGGPTETIETPVDGWLFIDSEGGPVASYARGGDATGGDYSCSLYPAVLDGKACFIERRRWSAGPGYSSEWREDEVLSIEDGVRRMVEAGEFDLWGTTGSGDSLSLEQARIILLALCGAARGHDKIDVVTDGISDDVYDLGDAGDSQFSLQRLVSALAQVAEWDEADIPEPAIAGMLRDLPWPTRRISARVRGADGLALALRVAFKPFGSLDEMDTGEQAKLVLSWLGGDFSAAAEILKGPSSAQSSQWSRARIGIGQVQWVTPTSGTVITCAPLGDYIEVEIEFGPGGSVSRAQTIELVAQDLGLEIESTLV